MKTKQRCTCTVNFVIIMNSLFKLFEIVSKIIQSDGFDANEKKKKKKKKNFLNEKLSRTSS